MNSWTQAQLLGLALALASTAPVQAGAEGNPQHIVLADLGLHVVGVGYQRTVSEHFAVQLDLDSWTPWTQNINFLGLSGEAFKSDISGVVLRARPIWYVLAESPRGLWVSPFGQVGQGWATRSGVRETGPVWALGGSVGYAWLPFDRLHISIGLGAQVHGASIQGGESIPSFTRPYAHLDGMVGWAF